MKHLLLILALLIPELLFGQATVPSTPYTRTLLRSPDAPTAQAILQLGTAGTTGNTNITLFDTLAGTTLFKLTNGIQLGLLSPSVWDWQTNFLEDSSGGAQMQRIFGGSTNGFMPAVNAIDYGLTTSGDQTAHIQAAVNAATNLGNRVIIPAGTYTVNGTITLWKGVELMGESPPLNNSFGTVLSPGAGANTMVFIPTGSAGTYIHNLAFVDGSAHNLATAISTSTNANPVGTSNIKIENVSIYGLARGAYFNYSWDIQLINNSYSTTTTCVQGTNNVNAVDIWGGHFFGIYGVKCDGFACFAWNIHSVFEVCSNAIFFANDCEQMNVTGCYAENNTNFVSANGTYALNIDHNEIDLTSSTNIVLVGCKFPYIGHNRFSATPSPSWDVDSTTYGLRIDPSSFNGAPSWHNAAATSLILDGTNIFNTGGYSGLVNNKASLMSSNLPTSATWLFTNTDIVNWICYITGGTVSGISQNMSPLAASATGITNASLTVILQPGESLGVTNGATAPNFAFKRF